MIHCNDLTKKSNNDIVYYSNIFTFNKEVLKLTNKKNPFKILGFEPDVLRSLNDEQINILISDKAKSLKKIFHPDKKDGNEEKFKMITDAAELIDQEKDKESYQYYKKLFLKKSPKQAQIDKLENEVLKARNLSLTCYQQLLDYLCLIAGFKNELSVFNSGPAVLNIRDYGESLNVEFFTRHNQKKSSALYFQIIIDEKNQFSYQDREGYQDKTNHHKLLIGTINSKTIAKFGSLKKILEKTQQMWTPDDQYYNQLSGNKNRKPIDYFENKIEAEEFIKILPLLSPLITQYSYLFSMVKKDNDIFFELEGHITKIEKL